MSTELDELYVFNGAMSMTQFSGGVANGLCIQLTSHKFDYIQLTRSDTEALIMALSQWLVDSDSTPKPTVEDPEEWQPLFDWDYIPT